LPNLVTERNTSYIDREGTDFLARTEKENAMRNEFTAIVEQDDGWFIAYSPEVPGANGLGRTKQEAMKSLSDAIALVLEDRKTQITKV
jgi:predicted RNase H-like HicB family nuclease